MRSILYLSLLANLYPLNSIASNEGIYLDFPNKNNKSTHEAMDAANAMIDKNTSNTSKDIDLNHLKQHQYNNKINVQPTNSQGSTQTLPVIPVFPIAQPPAPIPR